MIILCLLVTAYQLVVLAYVILSFVPEPPSGLLPVVRVVNGLVDPIVRPLRGIIPSVPLGGARLDLTIIVLFILLIILQEVVC